MSRSGYSDEVDDDWALIRWRGAVKSALNGKRGQAALRELLAAMDAMPVKELIDNELVSESGQFCTLGVLGAARGLDIAKFDPEDYHQLAEAFGLSRAMVQEIEFHNDEYERDSASRWNYMRAWVDSHIKPDGAVEND